MIKKKGFTLIELLAVIVILAIIALIAVPIILNIVSKSKKSAFLDSAYGLIESAKLLYAESILDGGLSEEKTFSFDNGKPVGLEYSGSSPKGGVLIVTPNGEISIAIHNNEWCAIKGFLDSKVTLSKYEKGKCMLSENEKDPMITLNGDAAVYVEVNGAYTELGAKAQTRGGDPLEYTSEIKKEENVVTSIDTSVEGTYKVIYSTSSNDKTATITRTVVVLQMIPVITMTDENETYVKEKDVLISVSGIRPNKVTGFTYEIKKDGVSLKTETVSGLTKTITLNETGLYEIVVTVTDDNNHTNTLNKTYKIDQTKPIITVPENTNIKITEVTSYDLMTGVVVSDNVDPNPTVETIGGLSAILGEQTVTYKVVDEAGNEESVVRKFTVVEAEGPILNFSNRGSELWTKEQTITVTATDNSNLKTFTYEVMKDGVSKGIQSVSVSGKSAEVDIELNGSGIYSIKLTGSDIHGNTNEDTSDQYKIDVTEPKYTVKSTDSETILEGASNVITDYFNTPVWGMSGTGSVVCKNGNTAVTNTSSLAVGTHTIICTATGNTGLKKSASKTIIAKVEYSDATGANKPTLSNGLIPIKWNGSTWIRADVTNKKGPNEWYDYSKQMWANAASVTSSYRSVAVGDSIPESAINAYFVWIPRYEYDYINIANYAGGTAEQPGEIKVNFITTSKTSPSSNYKIHPAFTFGSRELAGIWIGKFETTGSAEVPTIKPNLSSLRNQNVSTQFATSQKFSASGNSYGISTSADAHMMKNSEWGAVAYLSQSKYGKYGNSSYSGAEKQVYINNSNDYITGCSLGALSTSNSTSCAYTYEKSLGGTGASTSGTIYGIYDMSGGAYEYVMGVYNSTIKYAGFSSLPKNKYYDNYTSTTVTSACNSGICYGHALSETSGWYSDSAKFVSLDSPWFIRGGYFGYVPDAGVFSFRFTSPDLAGGASGNFSFRTVLLD